MTTIANNVMVQLLQVDQDYELKNRGQAARYMNLDTVGIEREFHGMFHPSNMHHARLLLWYDGYLIAADKKQLRRLWHWSHRPPTVNKQVNATQYAELRARRCKWKCRR